MRLPRARFVVGELPARGEAATLPAAEAAHARARRLRPGDAVLLCDGSGREARGVVTRMERGNCEIAVEQVAIGAATGPDIVLYVAGARRERLSWIVEKATELSARRLAVVRTGRTQAFRASQEGLARLERVARAAAKQCGASRWPELSGPHLFARVLEQERARNRIFLDASGEPFPPRLPDGGVAILVGPEGGWTDAERTAARDHGWSSIALPAGTLRAETAAIAALVLARAALTPRKL
ncbi:MAG TPA: RsmE family RNA methyltransferase [Thermoanaerobaculia bacterium]|nr:RsmE family RNA methyltransferase [Thermoanaerobaculia bacterium]